MSARPVVLVDARNVLRSRWPNIREGELVRLACSWAGEQDVEAVLVFDGRAPDSPGGGCEAVGSGGESADDWIARAAAGYAADGQPYWLVTSDRGLRARAGDGAARTIGGGSFAGELLGGPS